MTTKIILLSRFSLLIGLFWFCGNAVAQTYSTDLWLSNSFKYDLSKKVEAKIEFGHRRENFYASRIYIDFVGKYSFNKYAKIALGWRHATEGDLFENSELTNRFHLDFTGKLKAKDFSLAYRVRYQRKYTEMYTSENGLLPNESVRTRLLLGYKLNKEWSFDAGFESFLQLTSEEPNYIDRLRYIATVNYRINKSQDIALSYILQQEVQVGNPHTASIISIDYAIDLKRVVKKFKKKRKKRRKKLDEK